MLIQDWFDITNLDHLRAYKHLMDEGSWPEDFIPAHGGRFVMS